MRNADAERPFRSSEPPAVPGGPNLLWPPPITPCTRGSPDHDPSRGRCGRLDPLRTDHHVDVHAVELDITSEDPADAAPPMGNPGKRLAALIPSDAEVTGIAKAVASLVSMADDTRSQRTHTNPSRDGSETVSAVVERLLVDCFRRIGPNSLLAAGSSL